MKGEFNTILNFFSFLTLKINDTRRLALALNSLHVRKRNFMDFFSSFVLAAVWGAFVRVMQLFHANFANFFVL